MEISLDTRTSLRGHAKDLWIPNPGKPMNSNFSTTNWMDDEGEIDEGEIRGKSHNNN